MDNKEKTGVLLGFLVGLVFYGIMGGLILLGMCAASLLGPGWVIGWLGLSAMIPWYIVAGTVRDAKKKSDDVLAVTAAGLAGLLVTLALLFLLVYNIVNL